MPRQRSIEDLSSDELRQLLIEKRREEREARLNAYRKTGRVIRVEAEEPARVKPEETGSSTEPGEMLTTRQRARAKRKSGMDKFLFGIEIAAIVGLFFIILSGVNLLRNLNKEFASALSSNSVTPTALITAVVLPGGHTAPQAGIESAYNEAEIPEHLRPLMQSYYEMPIPEASSNQARQIQVPAISLSAPVVLGDGWEQLKKGVGQHLNTANPGDTGNVVLSAHNDIFGELFRDLDRLKVGDEVILITSVRSFTYKVTGSQIVEPTRVDLMAQTTDKTLTLISCYPYGIDTKRIIVTAVLVED